VRRAGKRKTLYVIMRDIGIKKAAAKRRSSSLGIE
jgi:hypothetical protein